MAGQGVNRIIRYAAFLAVCLLGRGGGKAVAVSLALNVTHRNLPPRICRCRSCFPI